MDDVWECQEMATGELEKITINLGLVDLGQIDLLVREGFYANRTDFIRTAIRNQLAAMRHGAWPPRVRTPPPGSSPRSCRPSCSTETAIRPFTHATRTAYSSPGSSPTPRAAGRSRAGRLRWRRCIWGRYPAGMPTPAPSTTTAALAPPWNSGPSTVSGMLGRVEAFPARTPTPRVPTPQRRWLSSSNSTRNGD